MDTCICMAESLQCSPETITTNWLYPNTKKKKYQGKNMVFVGFGTICSFAHPLGVWDPHG